ncbi:hypothetical protein D7B24_001105 [Verticillium nonalfalfae]|uniref:Zn(2)-C6 fungal-type domain-containing protein n=1 Tax=Verticillium nonalfalfae TaxID=1051616 RepID=A0A3M9YH25_9PEZI|nr:uncharacterized protein D7B24_001105 [Verticillium nonalfalfae]RNJ59867.1 hypothetical protein D7B24_001105 [Verticillium nonalfalfae]
MSGDTPVLRRPNGRPQACEPCRRRKVACDHTHPVCRRCQAGKKASQCEYIVDTRTATASTHRAGSPLAQAAPRRRSASPPGTRPPPPAAPARPEPSPERPETARPESPRHVGRVLPGPGYLGFMSYCDIYDETDRSLSLLRGGPASETTPTETRAITPRTTPVVPTLSRRSLETCLTVLRHVPTRAEARRLFDDGCTVLDCWVRQVTQRVMLSLYEIFGHCLGDSRKETDLIDMAHLLSRNTSVSLSDKEADSDAWIQSFSGRNLRWDTLGVMFVYWAFGGRSKRSFRMESGDRTEVAGSVLTLQRCIDLCVELSRGASEGNILLLYVLYQRAVLESMIAGDASPSVWRYHGEAAGLIMYLGIHAETARDAYVPTLAGELRRRLCGLIMTIDKVGAIFTGRPPLMSRRYISTPLPLDLRNEDLMGGHETMVKAMGALDENGWNTSGGPYPATVVRARTLLSLVKDEIIEIALGNDRQASVQDLLALKARQDKTMAELPQGLKYDKENLTDYGVEQPIVFTRHVIQLEHLQAHFLIQRLLIQRGYDGQADLIAISFAMVSLTVKFWTHMDRFSLMIGDFEWLVMAYAAPSGGILCQELLKPSVRLPSVGDETAASGASADDMLQLPTRFAMIEHLFLLVGFLDRVSPSAPNGDLCRDCKVVIRRVLEQSVGQPPVAASDVRGLAPWDVDLQPSVDFNFELLDTFDWIRAEAGW